MRFLNVRRVVVAGVALAAGSAFAAGSASIDTSAVTDTITAAAAAIAVVGAAVTSLMYGKKVWHWIRS
jgi:hypothetical protein